METVRTLIDLGAEIWFEEDVGQGINVSNEEFVQAGLKKHTREECLKNGDLILTIQALTNCLLYTSPSPRDGLLSRMPSSA